MKKILVAYDGEDDSPAGQKSGAGRVAVGQRSPGGRGEVGQGSDA